MIHAYLFVTNNHLDHDDHGNEFQKHMKRINQQGIIKKNSMKNRESIYYNLSHIS